MYDYIASITIGGLFSIAIISSIHMYYYKINKKPKVIRIIQEKNNYEYDADNEDDDGPIWF